MGSRSSSRSRPAPFIHGWQAGLLACLPTHILWAYIDLVHAMRVEYMRIEYIHAYRGLIPS